jgi:UPF0716 protein FxsA
VFALLAIFIVVPIAELYVIFKIGDSIGWLPTLAILVADSLLGTYLMRTQGRAVWQRFTTAIQAGRMPHQEVIDGVLVIFGGAFLITPGFLTDIIGLVLLLPPTRNLIRPAILRRVSRRAFGTGREPSTWDVDGTAVEPEPPRRPPTDPQPPRLEP